MKIKSLTRLLSVIALIVFGIILFVTGYLNRNQYKTTIFKNGKDQVNSINHALCVEYGKWLNERYDDGHLFSRNGVFGSMVNRVISGEASKEEINRVVNWQRMFQQNENYSLVILVDTTGRELLRDDYERDHEVNLNLDYVNILTPQIRVGRVKMGMDSVAQPLTLFLIVPVYPDPNAARPVAYMIYQINPSRALSPMFAIWDSFYPSLTNYLILRIENVSVVISQGPAGEPVAYGIDLTRSENFRTDLSRPEEPYVSDVFGSERIVCQRAVEGTNWTVGTSMGVDLLYDDLARRTRSVLYISLLLFLVAGLVLLLLWRIQRHNMAEKELASARDLEESAVRYRHLFINNPIPMWIYRLSDLKFLEVNEAAVRHYGYSQEEFKSMTLMDIRPPEEADRLQHQVQESRDAYQNSGIWKHKLKSGRIIEVEIISHLIDYEGEKGALVMAYDVTERETELKDLWDFAPVGYHSLDAKGIIIRINATELQWLGYEENEVVHKMHMTQLLTPASKEFFINFFPIFQKQGFAKDLELEFLRKDGSILPVLVSSTAYRNPDGSFHHARSTVMDDTLLRAARVDREQKYKMLMENSFDVVFLMDMNLRYTYISPACTRLTGHTPEEILSLGVEQVMTPDSARRSIDAFHGQINAVQSDQTAKPGPQRLEIELLCKDGTTVWTEVVAGFLFNSEGLPVGLMGITRDISERRKFTEELIEARDRAQESDKLKSAFLANMSHEIRTPLNAIVGFSGLLDEAEDAEERTRYITMINDGTDQLLQIIDDILDISRIEAGQILLNPTEFSIHQMFAMLDDQFRGEILRRCPGKILLESVYPNESFTDTLRCDRGRLVRVLSNLLDNAIKFTPQGTVVFGYEPGPDPETIRFFVRDTGIGVRKDQQQVIFERFRQGENSLNRRFGGTGLGLSISRSFIELMGGAIGVNSEEGQGAEFWFTIPLN